MSFCIIMAIGIFASRCRYDEDIGILCKASDEVNELMMVFYARLSLGIKGKGGCVEGLLQSKL